MMLYIAILLAVTTAALLFVTFLKIHRDKRFVEDTRIAMLCTPQGVRQGEARAHTLSVSRKRFPGLIVFNTVYWENDWGTMRSFIEHYEIPVLEMPRHTRGKIARWVAAILACKYAIDLNKRMMLVEDDVLLPQSFNFKEAMLPLRKYDFVKLSKWGEAYLFNRRGGEKFIQKIYELGIHTHSDEFIKANVSEFTRRVIEAEFVQTPKNEGNIRDTPTAEDLRNVHLSRVGSDKYAELIETPIFFDEGMNTCDLPGTLRHHLDTLEK